MKNNIVGERIRTRRQQLRMTQTELANRTGYSDKTAISKIEHGENDLTQSKIVLFADALNTSIHYIMGWTNNPEPIHIEVQSAYDRADEKTKRAVRIMLGIED